ncbi:MAG TPA: glycosyl transferase [Hyphomicrobiaceae bacterium]|nr:glycosyl transferase [Hyphomicrobiaceae bacterium]
MPHIPFGLLLAAVAAAALTWGLTGLYLRAMTASQRFVPPNERSMHERPVPSGAGVVMVLVIGLLWLTVPPNGHGAQALTLAGGALLLTALGWIDDQWPLPPIVRLGVQAAAVAAALASLPADAVIAPFLPFWLERLLTGLAWLWFINLFNFMDGIDGLAGGEAIAVAVGYMAVVVAAGLDPSLLGLAALIAAASGGYMPWNWHPARALMGDAGAIPLGFLTGWLMIDLALKGLWPAALTVPLYFTTDATLTLLWRLGKGSRPWTPHREHFYQEAVLAGATPPSIVARVAVTNLLLIALALISIRHPALAMSAAAALMIGLLLHFARPGSPPPALAAHDTCDAPSNET